MGFASNLIKKKVDKAENMAINIIIYTLIGIIIGQIYAVATAGQDAFMYTIYALIIFLGIRVYMDSKKSGNKND